MIVLAFPQSRDHSFHDALIQSWHEIDPTSARELCILKLPSDITEERQELWYQRELSRLKRDDAGFRLLGGFSLAARIMVHSAAITSPRRLLCLGYPFHRRGDPLDTHGLPALQRVTVPTLILQGTRDTHGNQQQVHAYTLPANAQYHWIEDGNHTWQPRKKSGLSADALMTDAVRSAIDFLHQPLLSRPHE